jgi:PKD repeat protein
MRPFVHWSRPVTAFVAALALLGAGSLLASAPATAEQLPGPAPMQQRTSGMVTADALPTAQIDAGVVWTQEVVGNTVYAGGSFSNARPPGAAPGTNLVPRSNILAYDLTTGALTSFAATINGTVKVIRKSPDGSRIYVGGAFNSVNGQTRWNVAAFSTATGELLSTFRPAVGGSYVNAIAATGSTVYVGGLLGAGNGVARKNLLAFNTGGTLLSWAPTTDLQVDSMVLTPKADKLIVAGRFSTVNGVPQRGMAALGLTDGALLPWAANQVITNGLGSGSNAGKAGITEITADANAIYGTGWVFANKTVGNLEGTFSADPDTGNVRWVADCHGDTYGVFSNGSAVYVTSHNHDCETVGGYPQADPAPGNLRHSQAFTTDVRGTLSTSRYVNSIYADWGGYPAPAMVNWFPDWVTGTGSGQGQAGWTATGNADYVVVGGEFPFVNGQVQQGLVRFAKPSVTTPRQGPRLSGTNWVPNVMSFRPNSARITIQANWDRDDMPLTYEIFRSGSSTPVKTLSASSTFWDRPGLTWTDTAVNAGTTYSYRVEAVDGNGNRARSSTVPVTVSSQQPSAYADAVVGDGAVNYWRLGEPSGSAVFDWAGASDMVTGTNTARGTDGAIGGDADKASTFPGDGTFASTQTAVPGPNVFSTEAWIKTTSTTGGKIVGFGNQKTGTSSNYDRHTFMDADGYVHFGVYNNATYTVKSPTRLNDGQWHHVVGTLDASGLTLYVDGKRVGRNGGSAVGQNYNGFWRVGGDSSWGGDNYFDGAVDDVAIYPTALSLTQVQGHYTKSGRTLDVAPTPTDAYGKAVVAAQPDLYWRLGEASGTTARDSSGNDADATYSGGVTLGAPGGVTGTTDKAARFDGGSGLVVANGPVTNPTVYSQELWFNTTTTQGGKLIGFGAAQTGLSGSYDRHVYMFDDGRLRFGAWTGQTNVIDTSESFNDGAWHHLVATQGPDGMKLYVDGTLRGTHPNTGAENYTGYWRLGGDNAWGGNSSAYFAGTLDEVAVYSTVLSQDTVRAHFAAGGGQLPNQSPTAAFVSSSQGLKASFDAAGSTDPDGTIASYAWDLGDGAVSSAAKVDHTYARAGTYTVRLTVTDNRGGTDTVTREVAVTNTAPTAAFTSSATGLEVSFDGTGSTDPDGTIASYAWDFGNGTTSTVPTPTVRYAAAGTYQVRLTVTDSAGDTATLAKSVTVDTVNAKPTAAFTSSVRDLTASFDGSGSSDTDGTIASYAWDFGDGSAAASGAVPEHSYASAGTYSVKLTVTDNRGGTDSVTQAVTVTAPNQKPTAAFTSSATGLSVAFDGTSSSDPDGSIASYAWDFGNGDSSTAAKPFTTYAAAGTYSVKLTVTDNRGATDTLTRSVTVNSAPPPLAADDFGRSVASGWGTSTTGGPWSTSSGLSVAGGTGQMLFSAKGQTRTTALSSVSAENVNATVSFALDKVVDGGGYHFNYLVRRASDGDYRAKVRVLSTGAVSVSLAKYVGTTETVLASRTVSGLTYTPNTWLSVRIQAVSAGASTSLNARVWPTSGAEPTAWQVTTSDSQATLQRPGAVGISGYVASTATNVPITTSVDNLLLRAP